MQSACIGSTLRVLLYVFMYRRNVLCIVISVLFSLWNKGILVRNGFGSSDTFANHILLSSAGEESQFYYTYRHCFPGSQVCYKRVKFSQLQDQDQDLTGRAFAVSSPAPSQFCRFRMEMLSSLGISSPVTILQNSYLEIGVKTVNLHPSDCNRAQINSFLVHKH